jgi:hypothetical protein
MRIAKTLTGCASAVLMLAGAGAAMAQDATTASREASRQSRNDGPVSCIGGAIPRSVDRDVLATVVLKGFQAENSDEQRVMTAIGNAVTRCRGRYGWGDARQAAATAYFRGSTMRSNAAYRLRDYGVHWWQFDTALATVAEEDRQKLMSSGSMSGATMTAAARALESEGAAFGTPTPEQLGVIGPAIAQGLAGTIIVDQAKAEYNQ